MKNALVLWIVPTTQIYNQTLKALKDRDHPYRQQIDLASGGRTMVLEKTSGFGPRDVEENLCILLLMLPSANRETKAQLRMFRDSGGFERFFPADDDVSGHESLLKRTPNLDTFDQEGDFWGRQAKTSLGNTLRLLRPLIVLDEGHKAYSRNAKATLEGFNPCMIVELSATPPPGAIAEATRACSLAQARTLCSRDPLVQQCLSCWISILVPLRSDLITLTDRPRTSSRR